jgi:hypothetical protein
MPFYLVPSSIALLLTVRDFIRTFAAYVEYGPVKEFGWKGSGDS